MRTDISESVLRPAGCDRRARRPWSWSGSAADRSPGTRVLMPSSIEAAVGTSDSGAFGLEQEIGSASGTNADSVLLKDPDLTFDSEGRAVAVWVRQTNIAGQQPERDIEGTVKPAGDSFPPPSAVERFALPTAALRTFRRSRPTARETFSSSGAPERRSGEPRMRPAGSPNRRAGWRPSANAGDPGPQVAADAGGTAVAIWANAVAEPAPVDLLACGSSFFAGIGQAPDQAAAGQLLDQPSLATDASGNTLAVWRHSGLEFAPRFAPREAARSLPRSRSRSPTGNPQSRRSQPMLRETPWRSGTATARSRRPSTTAMRPRRRRSASARARPNPSPTSALPCCSRSRLRASASRSALQQTALTAAKRRRTPRGTTFRYSLSEPASVRIAIDRLRPGRRVGAKCRRPTRKLVKKRRCTRIIATGRLSRSGKGGANSTPFSGRLGKKALRPVVTAQRSRRPTGRATGRRRRRVSFNVVRF